VLTARHCVSRLASEAVDCAASGPQIVGDLAASSLVVVTGDTVDRGRPVARGARVLVPSSDRICDADIAVVVLDRDVTGIEPVAVDLTRAPRAGDEVGAVGYGRRGDTTGAGTREWRDGVQIVAVSPAEFEVGEAVCSGDSGGPALEARTGAVVGVVSRGGSPCVSTRTRNVYTRVDHWASLIAMGLRLGGGPATGTAAPRPPSSGTPAPASDTADLPADFGATCTSGDECESGYCARTGRYCTATCGADTPCPGGYHCASTHAGVRACFRD
jgi:hypothetical protein